jgi:rod shape-determining protein MreC
MYRRQVRRRRAVLLLLVAASLTLLSLYFREGSGGPLHSFQRAVATVFSPFEEVTDRALKPARDMIGWFDETFEARGQNKKLEEELAETRDRLAEAETLAASNEELSKLVEPAAGGLIPPGHQPVTARVVGRSPTVWYSTVTIDKGSSAGVAVNDAVVTGDGLVGRITNTATNTAQVTLITDHTSAVTARVVPQGTTGVVEPQVGDPRDMLLDFIEPGSEIGEGQTVVTAGFSAGSLESLFPPGIPIGEVSDASLEEQQAYQRVHIEPFADIRDMEFVQALVQPDQGGQGAQGGQGDQGAQEPPAAPAAPAAPAGGKEKGA